MSYVEWSDAKVAEEAYKFFVNSFVWKSHNFDFTSICMNRKQKALKKNFVILHCITKVENCTLRDLEKLVFENRSTISIAVTKMCQQGLVTKNQPEYGDDGRKVYFRTTEKGRLLLVEYEAKMKEELQAFIAFMSAESRRYFTAGVENLNKALEIMNKMHNEGFD